MFIFLVGLLATYFITKNFQQVENTNQKYEIISQSQAIAHTVQQQIKFHSQSLSGIAQRWHSIDEINAYWLQDIEQLSGQLPYLTGFNIYLIAPQPTLNIGHQFQRFYESKNDLAQQASQLQKLNTKLSPTDRSIVFFSAHKVLPNEEVISYLHAPIFNDKGLIGYLEATLNLTQLFDHQVSTYQITHPFSLSESGRTIYSALPERVLINKVQQQFTVPVLGFDWKLMVWPLHEHHFYQYATFIGLLLSILFSQLFYVVRRNKEIKRKLYLQTSHLKAINKDFTASKSKLIQSNKLSSLGEIATGIAHEINQPLQVICIHSDMCQENIQKQNYSLVEKNFRSIITQVERIEKIVKQVGSFGRDSEQDNYNVETPASIFESVINIIINQYNQEDVELRQVLPPSLPSIVCNRTQIEQVLVNLLINAKDAVEESDEKVVFIKAHDKQGKLYIEVSDTGSGIEPSKLDDIFTPFYTTKALGKGTGLGLSISYSIIHQHKGEFHVSSEMGKGSTFTVILPLN
ncbi:hypothetical protein CW745_04790 [Psychromonas sp. psych-6C06]|uniref:ATP-binding protein n=1 Tax=Psychromonas sp. psych-6C06 TaxID=2058089 RepID=UPI000C344E1B|nr:ATP-binding protein [Psychromonas sp. psych-6C06]PKF62741.1 hypothetical protein CW745_04790 [Psychromonas sp. psych-6C06]